MCTTLIFWSSEPYLFIFVFADDTDDAFITNGCNVIKLPVILPALNTCAVPPGFCCCTWIIRAAGKLATVKFDADTVVPTFELVPVWSGTGPRILIFAFDTRLIPAVGKRALLIWMGRTADESWTIKQMRERIFEIYVFCERKIVEKNRIITLTLCCYWICNSQTWTTSNLLRIAIN